MFRNIFIFYLFCFVSQSFAHEIQDSFKNTEKPTIKDAARTCSSKFPDLPDDVVDVAADFGILLKDTEENVAGAKCFMNCMTKILHPEIFGENGKISIETMDSNDSKVRAQLQFVFVVLIFF